jgi:hypothetical protein
MPESEEMKAIKAQIEETKGKLLTLGDEIVTAVKSKEDAPFNESLPVVRLVAVARGSGGSAHPIGWESAPAHCL